MRPTIDVWALNLALLTAKRSTCLRRQVGCVLLNQRGHVIATGYNGVAAGLPHCNEVGGGGDEFIRPFACKSTRAPSGAQLDGCQAIHAEQNALLQCMDVHQIQTAYVTVSPCMTCTKLLLNTSCRKIIFLEGCPHQEAETLWTSSGRDWVYFSFTHD